MSAMVSKVTDGIEFESTVSEVGSVALVRLPKDASQALPSRGQVAVHGTIDGHEFRTVVEPDGLRGHWIRISPELRQAAGLRSGHPVTIAIEPVSEWPEPEVPTDLAAALDTAPAEVQERWHDITPMARWEWVRWVNATANPVTRQRRVDVTATDSTIRKCGIGFSGEFRWN